MASLPKLLLFMLVSTALLADLGFIIWATGLNFLIVVPAVLSACYLAYLTAYYTVLNNDGDDKFKTFDSGVLEMHVHEFGEGEHEGLHQVLSAAEKTTSPLQAEERNVVNIG